MTAVWNQFYVTLFGNSSHKSYEDNTISAFTVKIVQAVDLDSVENWEVRICEISCPPPILGTGMPLITIRDTLFLVYCNVIFHNFYVMTWSAVYARSSFHLHIVKIYLINFIMCLSNSENSEKFESSFENKNAKRVPFRYSKIPTKVDIHFR